MSTEIKRCTWAGNDPLYVKYHDEEWGKETHDDKKLFEFLILEGAHAGLSWITILKKRKNYQKAFDGLRAEKIARYGARDFRSIGAALPERTPRPRRKPDQWAQP